MAKRSFHPPARQTPTMYNKSAVALSFLALSAAAYCKDTPTGPKCILYGKVEGAPGRLIGATVVASSATGTAPRLNFQKLGLLAAGANDTTASVSDTDGSYCFANLKSGVYTLRATRAGRAIGGYGAGSPTESGAIIGISGNTSQQVDIAAFTEGSLSGKAMDTEGRPIENLAVSLLVPMNLDGNGTNIVRTSTTTNDLGEFRFAHLPAGQYFVAAEPPRQASSAGVPATNNKDQLELIRTFYPGAKSIAEASQVSLKPGEDASGLDLTMQRGSRFRLSGRVVGPGGAPATGITISPDDQEQIFLALNQGNIGRDGAFDFGLLPPGNYRLTFTTEYKGSAVIFSQIVRLGDEDLTKLIIEIPRPFTVAGRLSFPDGASASLSASSGDTPKLRLDGTGHFLTPSIAAAWPSATDFTFSDLTPGTYTLRVGAKDGYYAKEVCTVTCSKDSTIDLTSGPPRSGLQVVLAHDQGKLSGSLGQDTSGHPNFGYVFLLSKNNAGRRFLAATDETGHFSQELPPDDYYAAAYKSFDYSLLDTSATPDTKQFESVQVPASGNVTTTLSLNR